MLKLPKKKIAQSGVVPFIIKNNKVKFLIITNTRKSKWMFPKGIVEKNMTHEESAGLEAFEEAGIMGEVIKKKIGSYDLVKYGAHCKVDMYPMIVEKILKRWPEKNIRDRRWVSPAKIKDYLKDKQLLKIVKKFNSLHFIKID